LAEVAWTPQADRRWSLFRARVATHAARWTAQGLTFTQDPGVPWKASG
jgi:hypothetical protein